MKKEKISKVCSLYTIGWEIITLPLVQQSLFCLTLCANFDCQQQGEIKQTIRRKRKYQLKLQRE